MILPMLTNVNRKAAPRVDRLRTTARSAEDGPAPVPMRFRGDPAIWAAWLYYRENMTQADIGKAMGVSRATVNAYISDARDRGVVSVRIDPSWLGAIELSEEITTRFGLQGTLVVPTPNAEDGNARIVQRIGRAGAEFLSSRLWSGATVGVAWGHTVLALAEAVTDPSVPDLTVAQLTGGTTSTFDFSPEFCASLLARRLKARCLQVTAPAVVSSPEVRSILMREGILAEQFRAIAQTDICVFGICTTAADSLVFTSGLLNPGELPAGPAGQAVAAIAGRFISSDGAPILDSYDERVVGMGLDQLRKVETRIAVAGGLEKRAAIEASLLGGYATHLVTDEKTAQALLKTDRI